MKLLLVFVCIFFPALSFAEDAHQELKETVRAEVIEVLSEAEHIILGTDVHAVVQDVRVQIREGERQGEVVRFENDIMILEVGDSIYVNRLESVDGVEYYTFKDADRRIALVSLALLFVVILFAFSGVHGLRALMSLAGSVVLICVVLVPLLLAGYSPVLVSVCVASVMLAVALYFTHGCTMRTTLAFLGTLCAVIITGFIASVWVPLSHLTGLSSDASVYLNFSTHGALDFSGLLLGSIIIGVLGVLDDVSITQASVVQELKQANATLTFYELYTRALRVGRDHIGSLVNTLALAYIGVSLPLVLLLAKAGSDLTLSLNQEIVASELLRTLVGSIGLVLAVPLTTFFATWWYDKHGTGDDVAIKHTHHHTH